MNPHSDCTPTKKQTKALHQAQRRADPVKRRLEQSSDTVRRRSARTNQAVQEHESEQQADSKQVPAEPHYRPYDVPAYICRIRALLQII